MGDGWAEGHQGFVSEGRVGGHQGWVKIVEKGEHSRKKETLEECEEGKFGILKAVPWRRRVQR